MKFIVIKLIFLVLFVSCKQEENKIETHPTTKTDKIDSLLLSLNKQNAFNGNVLIAEGDSITLLKSYGYADLDTKVKLNENSIFRLASITKQFTAIAILLLHKQGHLSIYDKAFKYIPEISSYKDVSILNLITHTSGLPDYAKLAEKHWDAKNAVTNKDVLNLIQQHKTESSFEPNTRWEYSNTGYIILAEIVRNVTNQNFQSYVNDNILIPNNLHSTFFYNRYSKNRKENMTKGYTQVEELNGLVEVESLGIEHRYTYLDKTVGAGGLASDIFDLLKWHNILKDSTFLSTEDKNLLYNNHVLSDGSLSNYGFGWHIFKSRLTGKRCSHGGDWAGYSNMFDRHLEKDKAIIILQNINTPEIQSPMVSIYQILYKDNDFEVGKLNEYAGNYSIDEEPDDIKIFLIRDGILCLNVNDNFFLPLIPIGKDNFIVQDFSPEVSIQFIRNSDGKIYKQIVYQNDEIHHASKL